MSLPESNTPAAAEEAPLHRTLGVWQATALNIANMVGIGPFITIPLFIAKMQGPQALIGWIIAAVLVLCDGLVWSELGAALPGSGGSYHFLSKIYGGTRWGRVIPFLFIWQFLISGTLEMASGYIGAVDYLKYALPTLEPTLADWHIPGGTGSVAAVCSLIVTAILCRPIRFLGHLGLILAGGTLMTVAVVIVAGVSNFRPELIEFPEGAFTPNRAFFGGLGGAMLIAVYDYLGYYNVCHLGDEVVNPGKTIPRAVVISIIVIALVYLCMNVVIIGVVPWQQAMVSKNIAAEFMETLYGRKVAVVFTALILWTVAACMFAIQLGYSRIPYAAARNGDFFRIFAVVHPVFCYWPLQEVIDAAVTVRILIQFIGQIIGLHLLRARRPAVELPFRMWLYPIPSVVALLGWLFVLGTSTWLALGMALGVVVTGLAMFLVKKLYDAASERC
ncbi:MAG: amino acid permease [Planctomycetota bacterium]|nr:amino acid permease [Planctomycetota bacterium]